MPPTRQDYLDTLRSSHRMRCSLEVWNADDKLVERLDPNNFSILEGQVDVDASSEVQRQLSVTLANTSETIFDPTNPSGALSAQRQLRAIYEVFVLYDGGGEWVEVPVFHGPISRVQRAEGTVQIEAQSKESLLLPPTRLNRNSVPNESKTERTQQNDRDRQKAIQESLDEYRGDLADLQEEKRQWFTDLAAWLAAHPAQTKKDYPEGSEFPEKKQEEIDRLQKKIANLREQKKTVNKVDYESYYAGAIIKAIARRQGESRLRVPRTNRKLREDMKLFDLATPDKGPWHLMQKLAGDKQLFYTAAGWLVMRKRRHNNPSYRFSDGPKGNVLTKPRIEWDLTTYRNTLELRAFEKKTKKQKENPALRVRVQLPRHHPLSSHTLGRHGVPRELLEVVETEHVYAKRSRAKADATKLLRRRDAESLAVEFDTLPVPHLEPGDLVEVDIEGEGRRVFTMKTWSIPLVPASMSVGYNRKITPRRRR
jgi:hypothetical protein